MTRRFQSQTRSRSLGYNIYNNMLYWVLMVSISDEKPVPGLQHPQQPVSSSVKCFNLRREAGPWATTIRAPGQSAISTFQSQTRSRSLGYASNNRIGRNDGYISIS